ncbi:hypothetical protein F5Y10DRAFT_275537 [Nemania abortiva]|nr:hypothetical protein F5Y10DRAFT_275537 [Nemania abortiva]
MALATTANSHIVMKSPAPFGSVGPNKVLTTSPLTSAQYPCQVGSNPATFYSKDGLDNKMVIGQPQTISFDGSAVHGGGSCQLALTKDPQPSASTSWQVILSIEGGCPSKSGTGTDEYQFTIPSSIAPGDYVFAWTWISKLSGTQEYYMNCAPVSISGGSAKRDLYYNETEELLPRDAALPELMVSNLAEINSCKSQLSTDPTYPNPGPNVQRPGTKNQFAPIQGTDCVPKGAKDVSSPGPGSGSGSSSSSAAAGGASSSSSAPGGGGVFVTTTGGAGSGSGASSTAAATSAASSSSSAAAGSSSSSGFLTVTTTSAAASETSAAAGTSSSAASGAASYSSSAPASGPSGAPGGGDSSGGLTGACTTEGMFNCLDGTRYQQCASGMWSTIMSMPATTKCAIGQTMTLWARNLDAGKAFQARRRGY